MGQATGTNWTFFTYDGLGSVRQTTDKAAKFLNNQDYDPYGSPEWAITGPGYTGEFTDPNGLLNLRARLYDPARGIFLTRDPVEGVPDRVGSRNGYAYVEGNPVNRTDPSGEIPQQWIPILCTVNTDTSSNCDSLAETIRSALSELTRRVTQLQNNMNQLPIKGPDSIGGHQEQFIKKQIALRKNLSDWKDYGCNDDDLPPGARDMVRRAIPSPKHLSGNLRQQLQEETARLKRKYNVKFEDRLEDDVAVPSFGPNIPPIEPATLLGIGILAGAAALAGFGGHLARY